MPDNSKISATIRNLVRTGLLLFVLGIVSVSNPDVSLADVGAMHINVDSDGYAIDRYDPVAYFTKGRPVRGSKKLTAEYQGAKYGFSSDANRTRFIENPKK